MLCYLFYCHLAFQRDTKPLSELSLFEFPLLRKSKGYTLDSDSLEAKKILEACQPPHFLRKIIIQG